MEKGDTGAPSWMVHISWTTCWLFICLSAANADWPGFGRTVVTIVGEVFSFSARIRDSLRMTVAASSSANTHGLTAATKAISNAKRNLFLIGSGNLAEPVYMLTL